jgi:hypothetical protein
MCAAGTPLVKAAVSVNPDRALQSPPDGPSRLRSLDSVFVTETSADLGEHREAFGKCLELPVVLSVALTGAMRAQDRAKQDMKDAGQEAKQAAKDTGHATKTTAKKAGHKVKHTTKKATHKAAQKTDEGAKKVEDKTQ